MYSLICRYSRVGLIPSQEAADQDVSNFQLELPSSTSRRASRLKSKLENSRIAKLLLLLTAMLGTSMVIGDGVLTPCISGTTFTLSLEVIIVHLFCRRSSHKFLITINVFKSEPLSELDVLSVHNSNQFNWFKGFSFFLSF